MRKICVLAILVGGLTCHAWAQSTADSGTKAKIIALEQLWHESIEKHDTRAIDSILDNTVLLINYDGSVQTKGDYLATTKLRFSKPSTWQPTVGFGPVEVRVFGTTAIATGVYGVKGIEHGQAYSRRERFMDTWKYKSGSWVIVGTQATPVLR